MRSIRSFVHAVVAVAALGVVAMRPAAANPPDPATFSIVAADPEAGEVGVAVASKFFAVGTVVPHATAGVGAVATQSFANTTYGPRGLELLGLGLTPDEVLEVLLRADEDRGRRQVGIVSAGGASATYTGEGCIAWAGGRHGPDYAVQGNILTGEDVAAAMERSFLESAGQPLAERLYEALVAGDALGGDSRGRQSAAILVVREKGGYAGFSDRAIDIRVDDHPEPFAEIGRLLDLALVNDYWNRGWTAFTEERFPDALAWQERATQKAEESGSMLAEVLYDLAVIRLANDDPAGARAALARSLSLNPQLEAAAKKDTDLEALWPELEEGLVTQRPEEAPPAAPAAPEPPAPPAASKPAAAPADSAAATSSGPLRGSRWELVSMMNAGDTSAPPDDASRPTLEFGDDGKVYGSGGCNRYFGSYELAAGGALSIGRVGATRMACPPPILDQEDAFFAVLGTIEAFAIAGDELTLTGAGDARLVFRAAPE